MLLKNRPYSISFIVLFILSSFNFYGPLSVNIQLLNGIYYCLFFFTLIITSDLLFKRKSNSRYIGAIKVLLLCIAFSIIPAYISWNQNFIDSFKSTIPYMAFILFPYLWKYKQSPGKIESVIWIITSLYILCFIYAFIKAPTPIFGDPDFEINDERGFFRFFIMGRGFLYLSFFLAINKLKTYKNLFWILITFILFTLIILHVTRQFIIFTFLIGVIYLFKNISFFKKLLSITAIYFIVSYAINNVLVFQNLLELTESQKEENFKGEENIRITAYKYFTTQFSPDLFTTFFGNGSPRNAPSSPYGRFNKNILNKQRSIYLADVGYASIYAQFGIVAVLAYLFIFYKALKQKVDPQFIYAKLFIIFIILANIFSEFAISREVIASICLSLYILDLNNLNQKMAINKICDE